MFESIHTVMHLFRAEQYRSLRDGPPGLTHPEGKVPGFFALIPAATLSDSAAHSGCDKGQPARLIKSLRKHGLLEARSDEADLRTVRLHLTAQGRTVHQILRRQMGRVAKPAGQVRRFARVRLDNAIGSIAVPEIHRRILRRR